jgi:hypothetical protein
MLLLHPSLSLQDICERCFNSVKMEVSPDSRFFFCLTFLSLYRTFVSGEGCCNSVKMVVPPDNRCCFCLTLLSLYRTFVSGEGCCNSVKMVVPPDNRCCFCLTLRTGVIVIGSVNLAFYLIAFLWQVSQILQIKYFGSSSVGMKIIIDALPPFIIFGTSENNFNLSFFCTNN